MLEAAALQFAVVAGVMMRSSCACAGEIVALLVVAYSRGWQYS
jgi:hypothetical protein